MKKFIHNIKSKIKALWEQFKYWLIKKLGGYTFPPTVPKIKAEKVETVKVSASLMVNKEKYDADYNYRAYVKQDVTRLLAEQIMFHGAASTESVVEFNDYEYIVKVSATLVKGGQ